MTDPAALLRQLAEPATDGELLRRFAATRDGAAFAELVRRHGPLVLAACRRGVRHHHDADDAFQAVFLVLARRAGTVRQPELLGNWLYRVAVGVARNARRAAARRREREVQGVDVSEPAVPTATAAHDLGPVIDEELDALPGWYRDAVVLCDLRGLSRADAAAALGVPIGTLASRLDAARKKLAARLVRRGVTLSVGAVLAEARAVAVPPALLGRACETVAVWTAGGLLPPAILELVRGGVPVRRMTFFGLAVVAATAVVGVGLAAATRPAQPPADPPLKEAPKLAPGQFERLVVAVNPGGFSPEIPCTLTLTPEGKCVYEIVGYPARGTVPAWPAAKRTHTLPADRMRRIVAELKATEWLAAAPAQEGLQLHQPKYAVTVHRGGKPATRQFEGEPRPYKELLALARGLAAQEFLAYRLEDVPGHAADARYMLDTYVQGELFPAGPYGKPPEHFDFARFGGWASRVVRAPADRRADDVITAACLAGLVRLASEREALTALGRHADSSVREAARAALDRLPDSN